ncbi:hypothetical protein CLV93_10532 [Prolixibacter denitrificans]|uniref:Uncharacterized protein n=1 Tax=Prolixibacter denitrificans TaxID=1541063 RepID=A0A2P8CCE7_9BACT|nr:hypothetical protein CLV93_10532 [Prolixibacter denitrificans]
MRFLFNLQNLIPYAVVFGLTVSNSWDSQPHDTPPRER